MDNINITQLVLLLAPVFLIQLGFAIYALIDLSRRKQVRGKKWIWAVLLVVTVFTIPMGIVTSGIYLAWGRNAEAVDDPD
jgi:heme/copper-type cytochrome/quinol oxidase subunit 2